MESLENSLANSANHFGEIGREHGARLGMSEAEVSDYLSQFRYRFSIDEHAAMAEFEMEYENLMNVIGKNEIGATNESVAV